MLCQIMKSWASINCFDRSLIRKSFLITRMTLASASFMSGSKHDLCFFPHWISDYSSLLHVASFAYTSTIIVDVYLVLPVVFVLFFSHCDFCKFFLYIFFKLSFKRMTRGLNLSFFFIFFLTCSKSRVTYLFFAKKMKKLNYKFPQFLLENGILNKFVLVIMYYGNLCLNETTWYFCHISQ